MQLLIPCYLGVFMCEYLNFSPLIWAGAYLDREKKKKKATKIIQLKPHAAPYDMR